MSGRPKPARDRLAAWMNEHGHTQTDLGLLLGVSQSAVGQWLADATRPSVRLRQVIERVTGIEQTAWETSEERKEREALEERLAARAS